MKPRHFVLIFILMILSGCNQGGPKGCGIRLRLPGVEEVDTDKSADCEGDACADVAITYLGEEQGHEVKNTGKQKVRVSVKWANGVQCQDFSDMTLASGQTQKSCSGSYCKPYKANFADPEAPTPPLPKTPKIMGFTINQNNSATVTAGTPVVFMITLDTPALGGGTKIGFSHITNTGLTDAIQDRPDHMIIPEGETIGTMQIRTQRVDRSVTTTHILFTASNVCNKRSAELRVNQ